MRMTEKPVREVDLYLSEDQQRELLSRKDRLALDPSRAISGEDMDKFILDLKDKNKI